MKFVMLKRDDWKHSEVYLNGEYVGVIEAFPESSTVVLTGPYCIGAPLQFKDAHVTATHQALAHLMKLIIEEMKFSDLVEERG